MSETPFQFGDLTRADRNATLNATRFSALFKTAELFNVTHNLAARRTEQIAGLMFLHSRAWRAQERVFDQLSMLRSPVWDAQRRMQQTSILGSAGWQAMQRAIERTMPLMSSAAYKRIARDTQLLATKSPGLPGWALRMFPRFRTVENPPHRTGQTYEPFSKYAEVVPLRRRLAKIRVIRRQETQADDGPQPDPNFGFRPNRW